MPVSLPSIPEPEYLPTEAFNNRYQLISDFIEKNKLEIESAYGRIYKIFQTDHENNFSNFIQTNKVKFQPDYEKIDNIYKEFQRNNNDNNDLFVLHNASIESVDNGDSYESNIDSVESLENVDEINSEEDRGSIKSTESITRIDRKSFLHKAAEEGNLALIKFLIMTGHEIDAQDNQHKTPLYAACKQLKLAAATVLLDAGADASLGNSHISFKQVSRQIQAEQTFRGDHVPLVATINSKAIVTAAELSAATTTGEDFSNLPDESATKLTAAKLVKALIEKDADVNLKTGQKEYSALHRAVDKRKLLIVQEIINSGKADFKLTDRGGETALHIVADYRDNLEKEDAQTEMEEEKAIAELLVQHVEALDIKENLGGNTPLHTAVIRSNLKVVKAIYKEDYRFFSHQKILSLINKDGNTPLHEAVKEAHRGPKVLEFLLRVATEDDLAVINYTGETAGQMAERLLQETNLVHDLLEEVEEKTRELEEFVDLEGFVDNDADGANGINVPEEIGYLQTAMQDLKASPLLKAKLSTVLEDKEVNELSLEIDNLCSELKNYDEGLLDFSEDKADELASRARKLHTEITSLDFLQPKYLDSLKNVKQENYFAWKSEQLQLPSSFPTLETIDPTSPAYLAEIAPADEFFNLAERFLAVNENAWAKTSIESAMPIYQRLKNYNKLEKCYQNMAKTYLYAGDGAITAYETENQAKLHSNRAEKLQGHLALAGLYKELREAGFQSPSFSYDDLQAHESFHYKEAYKLTQGALDDTAHVVLEGEVGIAQRKNIGTYNTHQCVVAIIFDPITQKAVLVHFNKYSGPESFMDQIFKEFPGESKLDLYLSGGRDRSYQKDISDSNIDQVLKQIYAHKDRFDIKAMDLGDKPSPEAVVFDWTSRQIKALMPNYEDANLDSRKVKFRLPMVKANYLRPLDRVDFSSSTDREIAFSAEERLRIQGFTNFDGLNSGTDAADHAHNYYPLMMEQNKIAGKMPPDFQQGLLQKALRDRYIGPPIFQTNNEIVDLAALDNLDINELSCLGRQRRDAGFCELDSESLLEKISRTTEAEQTKILDQVAMRKVGGAEKEKIEALMHNQASTNYLHEASKVSSNLMKRMFYKDALVGLLKGDPMPAIQLGGFKGSDYLLKKLSKKMQVKGLEWLAEGKLLQSNSIFCSIPPVMRSMTIGMTTLDLYKQISLWQADSNNTRALVGVVGDSVQLSTDLVAMSVEILEVNLAIAKLGLSAVAGESTAVAMGVKILEVNLEALAEVSAFTIPGAPIVGGIVMIGTQLYTAVDEVAQENHFVHLTYWERLKEGGLAFLGFGPEIDIQGMIDEVKEYNQLLLKQLEFLTRNPVIGHIIFPAIKTTETCRLVTVEERCSNGGGPLFASTSTCNVTKEVYDPSFAPHKNNRVYLADKFTSGFKLTREKIIPPQGSELLCIHSFNKATEKPHIVECPKSLLSIALAAPAKLFNGGSLNSGFLDDSLPIEGVYFCDAALGLTNLNSTGNAVFFNLGDGEDQAAGLKNSSNIFMVNEGAKNYKGGNLDDIFLVQAQEVTSYVNGEGGGGLNGGPGSDTLILQAFLPKAEYIEVNFPADYVQYGNKTLRINSIEKLIGGTFPLKVIADCATEEIDTAGGPSLINPDTITIPRNTNCPYNLIMHLQPNTTVTNAAEAGNFIYYAFPGKGMVAVNLTATADTLSTPALKQQFVFNSSIADVDSILLPPTSSDTESTKTITLNFLDHRIRRLLRTMQSISFTKPNATADVTLDYQLKSDSSLDLTRFALPTQLPMTQIQEILKDHLIIPMPEHFQLTFAKRHELRQIMLNLVNKVDGERMDGFDFKLHAHSFINTIFHFIDNAELRIGNQNLYLFLRKLNQSPIEIMERYAPVARRLNLICIITTQTNEQIVIGHKGKELMENNPLARTHLHGNGGEGLFVIQSGMESLVESQLPIKDVILHRRSEDTHTDSLDLRELTAQVRAMNATHKLLIRKNKSDNTIKLEFSMQKNLFSANKDIPIVTIFLNNVQNHWHKKYLHIILDLVPQQIIGRYLSLGPIPLKLDQKIESISIKDVEENTEVVIPRAYQANGFFHHNKTNLLWTNRLGNAANGAEPFMLILENFYQEPKLHTLFLKFTNKKISLKNRSAEINAAKDFEEAQNSQLVNLKAERLAIIYPKQLAVYPSQKKPANASGIVKQEHYSGNEINATSIEFDTDDYFDETNEMGLNASSAEEIDNHFETHETRRRRAIELEKPMVSSAESNSRGVIQSVVNLFKAPISQLFSSNAQINHHDKSLEIAEDFHDELDQKKTSNRKLKSSKKTVVESTQVQPTRNNTARQTVLTEKPVKNLASSKQLHISIDRQQTVKAGRIKFAQQNQIQPTKVVQNVKNKNHTFYNLREVKGQHALTGSHCVKGIENKAQAFARSQSLVQARLDHSYSHQQNNHQQQAKNPGIRQNTAPGDTDGLLFLARLFIPMKPQVALKSKAYSNYFKGRERIDSEIRRVNREIRTSRTIGSK